MFYNLKYLINMYLIVLFIVSSFVIIDAAGQRKCNKYFWPCDNGKCVLLEKKCDGVVDCPDGSDESFVHCRKHECDSDHFQCLYGGCVSKNATCDGKFDCVDKSDEMLPKCRGELDYDECLSKFLANLVLKENKFVEFSNLTLNCREREAICRNGEKPEGMVKCNGKKECRDGSDETMRECIALKPLCSGNYFRCAYGACIRSSKMCNGVSDCADGSDEIERLCEEEKRAEVCILPEFPKNGYYRANQPLGFPGRVFDSVTLYYNCNPGFELSGASKVYCIGNRWWSEVTPREQLLEKTSLDIDVLVYELESTKPAPKCIPQCVLPKDDTIEFWCLSEDEEHKLELKRCNELVSNGTSVQPKCRSSFYATLVLADMICENGTWNYIARCSQCGLVTSEKDALMIGGEKAYRGEMPWHAGIYTKTKVPYLQICGGSLISKKIVLSAAHCFWDDFKKKLPDEQFVVAVGKIYRPWNNTHDVGVQKSDVERIEMPSLFRGAENNFQQDIAVVILKDKFEYKTYVRPICLDFDYNFEKKQLAVGNLGKVAGWGLTAPRGRASPILKVVELPYIDLKQCYEESPASFKEYITTDKICAGYKNGTALCKGDSGGGLTFLAHEPGAERYYLRGIVSTAPTDDDIGCNAYVYTSFTQISKHELFINKHLKQTKKLRRDIPRRNVGVITSRNHELLYIFVILLSFA